MGSILLFIQTLILASGTPTSTKPLADEANMVFKEKTLKLGTIYAEEKYERVYSFTNTGNAPLIIKDTETSCGCTVAEFPKEPIMPGKKGEIKVDYVPKKNTLGFISKSITITSNAKNSPVHIFLHGTVVKKEKSK